MIGQENLKHLIDNQFQRKLFPRFSILIGDKGSGRKTFINEYLFPKFKELGFGKYTIEDIKVESVRKMIDDSYKLYSHLFIIPDADNMSIAAKNALLKMVEEPVNNHYFIMTLEDKNNTLETIRSRGSLYFMDKYTPEDIKQYIFEVMFEEFGITDKSEQEQTVIDLITSLSSIPYEAYQFWDSNVLTFHDYTLKVLKNIDETSVANALKIGTAIKIKDTDTGYDLKLFLKMFQQVCIERAVEEATDKNDKGAIKHCLWARDTAKCLRELRIKGCNKQMLVDNWILSLRGE